MDRRELTIRGIVLGIAITAVFTAANVYLGLKVGLTFSSAIPAAVISMAVLQAFRGASIQENNIVQTLASSAGALSAIIFVLPGLVIVGWWNEFPFWMTFGICAVGGILGVMYSIPLRRALVTQSSLPYPEGVAAAQVLKVGVGSRSGKAEDRAGLITIGGGAIASAGFAALVGTKLFAGEVAAFFRMGATGPATGLGGSLSLALIGAGHLMGIAVGMAMLVGVVIAWGVAVPLITAMNGDPGPAGDIAKAVAKSEVRFIGAGVIGAAAIWTLGKLVAPIMAGLAAAAATARKVKAGEGADLPRTERDIPLKWVVGISAVCMIPLAILTWGFLQGGPLAGSAMPLIAVALVYIVIAGFLVAAVCGYMAGLIGSSNSPVSGVAILAVLGAALLLAALARSQGWVDADKALIAFALFITSVLLAVAVIANDNLQDLKTGQLVDATPWRQQVALMIGVVAGAIVIPPVLYLLNEAYGFAGTAGAGEAALPAPQANLISTLAQGVIGRSLDWGLLGIGALIGVALVAVDEILRRTGRFSLPPLAVGLAIYLPTSVTVPVILGAVLGYGYDRWAARQANVGGARQLGVLLASGLIVGESLLSVALAGLIVATGREAPLALVGDSFEGSATVIGLLAYLGVGFGLYAWTRRQVRKTPVV